MGLQSVTNFKCIHLRCLIVHPCVVFIGSRFFDQVAVFLVRKLRADLVRRVMVTDERSFRLLVGRAIRHSFSEEIWSQVSGNASFATMASNASDCDIRF
jgi:hypothetical protein